VRTGEVGISAKPGAEVSVLNRSMQLFRRG
jgi:hypothetical protein